ncbi:alpha/beta fold hydrolase [Celeribacter sp. PS-C1]|uniref:alpha/beta fold hydrolase n=1 Tax=Celeribacter sp. PS-C1 TaxID=2820813 RepID=UPI001C680140|nr:alpha/beta hydrolase [Celeribacter sp. PS-C1]MBW6416766.1 alpha/beta hydrolase [Celeribacter sp. PS-C1]
MTETAPYFADLAQGPEGGEAYWLTTSDGVRIRVGLWPQNSDQERAKGTVFILPGRTECVEKYGRGAADLAARGFASLAIDWRGQGLADRPLKDRRIGHVAAFQDYQMDLDAVMALAEEKAMPKPWFLIGHSMGGAIGIRALIEGKPFQAAGFSAPMWGIGLTPIQRLLVRFASPVLDALGLQNMRAPGTKLETYMIWNGFKNNLLTSDREMFDYMTDQVVAKPDLGLGGPSSHWVMEAIRENDWAAEHPLPDVPVLCFLGGDEKIVNTQAVKDLATRWPSCELVIVPGARHEVPMETPATRKQFYDRLAALFEQSAP